MKLLSISNSLGHFLAADKQYLPVDRLTKEDLLRLANLVLEEDEIELDEYDEQALKNQAHRVIYKSVLQNLQNLRSRRNEFVDQAARLFYEEYEGYKNE